MFTRQSLQEQIRDAVQVVTSNVQRFATGNVTLSIGEGQEQEFVHWGGFNDHLITVGFNEGGKHHVWSLSGARHRETTGKQFPYEAWDGWGRSLTPSQVAVAVREAMRIIAIFAVEENERLRGGQ